MAVLHRTLREKIIDALGFTPEPPGELSQSQLDYVISRIPAVDISGKVDKATGKDLLATSEAEKIHSLHADDQNLTNYVQTDDSRLTDSRTPTAHTHLNDHALHSDDQDLSGKSDVGHTHSGIYEPANSNIQTHVASSHAPSNAVALSTVKADSEISDAISKKHLNSLDHSNSQDHSHSNKVVLDAYTQTETNLASAVSLKHSNSTDHNGAIQDTAIAGKNPVRLLANLAAPVVSSGTTEKILLQLQIPAARAVVGSTFRATILGNSSSTGTLIFKIREGAGGTITDAIAWTAITSAAQAANKRAGFDALITVRSATTNYTDGIAYAGTLQLETVIAVPATSVIAISGVWYISLTVICSSGTFTAQVGSIEEIK